MSLSYMIWNIPFQMQTSRRKQSDEFAPLPDGQEAHWEVCERILFVYTKLNPGLGYIQARHCCCFSDSLHFLFEPNYSHLFNSYVTGQFANRLKVV